MLIHALSLDLPGNPANPEAGDSPTDGGSGSFGQAFLLASQQLPHMASSAGSALPLKSVAMGSVQLITPETPAPDTSELKAFAKAQGINPEAVAWLFDAPANQNPKSLTSALTATLDTGEPGSPLARTDLQQSIADLAAQTFAQNSTETTEAVDASTAAALLAAAPLAAWLPGSAIPLSAQVGAGQPAATPEPNVLPAGWLSTQALLSTNGKGAAQNPAAATADPPIPEEVMDLLELDPETQELLSKLGLIDKETTELKSARALAQTGAQLGTQPMGPQVLGPELRAMVDPLQRPTLLAGQAMAAPTAPQAENASPADRAAQIQALAEKISQALGQRIMGHIERGQWQVRLLLRPASLGEVEVDLRLRAGELDATLRAMNPLTRELLSEGLPRLREGLTQAGMDVAQLHVGTGDTSRNGGNPTPRDFTRQAESSGSGTTPASAGDPPAEGRVSRTGGADGWDVMV